MSADVRQRERLDDQDYLVTMPEWKLTDSRTRPQLSWREVAMIYNHKRGTTMTGEQARRVGRKALAKLRAALIDTDH